MIKFAVLGFGARGQTYMNNARGKVEFTAVCDKKERRLADAMNNFGLDKTQCYLSDEEFFARGKLADVLVIATHDTDHYMHAMRALDLGYHLLLEKPIADSYEKCCEIYEKATAKNLQVFVCHVLRYAPFFVYIKERIQKGDIGDVSTINLTENVAYWHQAHSFIRGKWGVTEAATPMIVQKCCHDIDILYWMINKPCDSVTSFGGLDYFTLKNAPEGCAEYCCDCSVSEDCPYSAEKIYKTRPGWLFNCLPYDIDYNDQSAVNAALADKSHKYGKCVFKCDNSAVDHQVVNMDFGGITAHLTMTAFSKECYREIHVHGTKGEIYGSMLDDKLHVNIFGQSEEVVDIGKLSDGVYGHGGGDARLMSDVVDWFDGKTGSSGRTSIGNSLMSHRIAYAAEKSRLCGGTLIDLRPGDRK